jgi:hypothetical protein
MYNKINVMFPSYLRAHTRLPKFVSSCLAMADNVDNLCFTVCVKESDIDTVNYLKSAIPAEKLCLIYENTDGVNLPEYFNRMYAETKFNCPETAVSMFGDDMVFETRGWDNIMLEKLNDACGMAIVYGDDDNVQHENLCVYFITSRRLVNASGQPFMCPAFRVEWIDTIWHGVGKKLGMLEYIPTLHIRHRHSHSPDVGIDKTTIMMKPYASEADKASVNLGQYIDEIADGITAYLKGIVRQDVVAIMPTYDRVYLFRNAIQSYAESIVRPPLQIFDDGSARGQQIKQIAGKYEVFVENKCRITFNTDTHVGCEKNHYRALKAVFADESIKWVVVIDSDAIVYPYWYLKVCDMIAEFNDAQLFGLFNKEDRYIDMECAPGYRYVDGCGGIGMVISREAFAHWPVSDKEKTGWDNLLCRAVGRGKIVVPMRSYVQHTGYIDGIHANDDAESQIAKNFCGIIREDIPSTKICSGDTVLVGCMSAEYDVVIAGVIVNALVAGGVTVHWATLKRFLPLAERVARGVRKKEVMPLNGIPDATYADENTHSLKECIPGYKHYLNLQVTSRENRSIRRNTELSDYQWMLTRMKKFTDIPMEPGVKITKESILSFPLKKKYGGNVETKILVCAMQECYGPYHCLRKLNQKLIDQYHDMMDKGMKPFLISPHMIEGVRDRTRQDYGINIVETLDYVVGADVVYADGWIQFLKEEILK